MRLSRIKTLSENATGAGERFVAVLEIPPVDSEQKAVQVQIVKDVKGEK
jgi:hypothetical protein